MVLGAREGDKEQAALFVHLFAPGCTLSQARRLWDTVMPPTGGELPCAEVRDKHDRELQPLSGMGCQQADSIKRFCLRRQDPARGGSGGCQAAQMG